MYQKELLEDEINEHIELFYKPYHQAIEDALNEKKKYFSKVYLIDLHSFGADLGTDVISILYRITKNTRWKLIFHLFLFFKRKIDKKGQYT